MTNPVAPTEREAVTPPWGLIGSILVVAQLAAMLGVFLVIFVGDAGLRDVAYGLAAVIVLLELAQVLRARLALRTMPWLDCGAIYASAPLRPGDGHLIRLNLIVSMLAPLVLLTVSTSTFRHAKLVELLVLIVAFVPAWLAEWRVQRNNSWLAISRIPGRTHRAVDEGS